MIRLQALAFGAFAEVEAFNSGFASGHRKMRITVDTETHPRRPDPELLEQLQQTFPGLAGHHCRMAALGASPESPPGPAVVKGIQLLEAEPSANQAHLLEHLLLEMLSELEGVRRLSGVTCAYTEPPERNDVFVECADPESGAWAALLGIEAMNAALAGEALVPLFPDALHCARLVRSRSATALSAAALARTAGIPSLRAAAALELLARVSVVESETYAMNLSGEPHYRFVRAGEARR